MPDKSRSTSSQSLRLAFVAFILVALVNGCSKTRQPVAEAPPPKSAVQTDQPQQISEVKPAETAEVEEAIERVFKEAVHLDTSRKPTFVVGDFNGDLSQDLAVALKPNPSRLSVLNEEFPNWMLRDLSGPTQTTGPRLRVTASDTLLAIIHGYDRKGWRDQQATQTFLLKNASGAGMQTRSAKEFLAAHEGLKVPQLRGDVVAEKLRNKSGYLYYAAATYAWYDKETVPQEPERRMVHMAPASSRK